MDSYVLITGATGGLGKAFTAESARRGWNLFLTDRSAESLATLAAGLERMYGVTVRYQTADLTDPAAREALWQHIDMLGLRFHFLFNVAGIDYQGLFNERAVDEIHTILRLNIESTVEMTHRVLDYKHRDSDLHIVNVSSMAAFYPMPVKAVYASSKRFLLDWSLALHQELRETGVTVTALCPAGMPSNPHLIRLIDAQGLAGRLTTVNVGDVASGTIRKALRGSALHIPGAANLLLRLIAAVVPPQLAAFAINRRWRKADAEAREIEVTRNTGSLPSMQLPASI